MPENLSYQYAANEPSAGPVVTYKQLLDDPAIHPGLTPHLERLAAADVGLEILQHPQSARSSESLLLAPLPPQSPHAYPEGKPQLRLVRTAEERAALPRLNELSTDLHHRSATMFEGPPSNYGSTYFKPKEKENEVLGSGEYSEQELADYLYEARVLCDAFEDVAVRRREYSDGSRYEGVIDALINVPLDKLRAVYNSEALSADLRYMLEKARGEDDVRSAFELVTVMHERGDILELWDKDSPAFDDSTFQELLTKEESMGAIASTLERHAAHWPEGTDPVTESYNKRIWSDRYLERVVGLPEQLRKELEFDATARTSNHETGMVNSEHLQTMLVRTANNVRAVGMDRVKQLHDEAGITNIDYYSSEPLKLMCAVLDGDPAAIKHLQEGDTTVVFTNAAGDHNGALSSVRTNYKTESNRTLYFEIKQPRDLFLYMIMLNKRGINPSTMVMAAHGNEGSIPIHDTNNGFQLLTNKGKRRLIDSLPGLRKKAQDQRAEYEVSQDNGFSRLIRETMQDSKGIDDNKEAVGRRRIIINACLAARPVEVRRPGMRNKLKRFIGMPQKESFAETITKTANNSKLDVFANEATFGAELTKDEAGVQHFMEYFNDAGSLLRRDELPATQFRLDRWGNVISRRIDHIPLHNTDNKQLEMKLRAA